jgi:C4-dicarboxylate-specific signal transduction histidine kinase
MQGAFDAAGVRLMTTTGNAPITIDADPARIEQVCVNLLDARSGHAAVWAPV